MSDYMVADITLGGPVPARLIGPLCAAIADEGVSLESRDASFVPSGADKLLAARCEDVRGVKVLRLYAEEKPYGVFGILEKFLQTHRLSYRRFSQGKYEHDPQIVEYRPQMGIMRQVANHDGEALVLLAVLRGSRKAMAEALRLLGQYRLPNARRHLKNYLKSLDDFLPEVPPLEPFEIKALTCRARHA